MVYTFNKPDAAERHTIEYFEIMGNRAIYFDGWLARTIHRAAWQTKSLPPLEEDVWDLYNVRKDFSLAKNLATKNRYLSLPMVNINTLLPRFFTYLGGKFALPCLLCQQDTLQSQRQEGKAPH